MQQAVVENRLQRLSKAIDKFHLNIGAAALSLMPDPERVLAIHQEAVSIDADAHPPAPISFTQILKRCIPDQPVQQKLLLRLAIGRTDWNQPGILAVGLCSIELLPEMKSALQ